MNKTNKIFLFLILITFISVFTIWYLLPHSLKLGALPPVSIILPNHLLTPGAINPNITQATLAGTLCNPTWSTKSIRPPVSYTNKLKAAQIKQYGYFDTSMANYEEDHLISLELGGSPTDPKNLWPESYLTIPNAKNKDAVENYLHKQVCMGAMTLAEAQKAISTDWTKIKVASSTSLGSVGGQLSGIDEDDN